MSAAKVLYICQEITPYLPENEISGICRRMPQAIQEKGCEIRTFMPKFGCINERRNQLHEVIRLSGMNIIIDDNDHPLIIKVASIQSARMQVYFIDNDDFFHRRFTVADAEGKEFPDNGERSIFYARGVIETVRKLRWIPDVIHCHGWMSAFVPLYLKKAFADDPYFKNAKIVYSLYHDDFKQFFKQDLNNKVLIDELQAADFALLGKKPGYLSMMKLAVQYSDGIILCSDQLNRNLLSFVNKLDKPVITSSEENDYQNYYDFYQTLTELK